jgi:putative transposase
MSRPRFGYERIHVLLRREGWHVNLKRVHRLYCLEGLQVRMRVRRKKRMSLHGGPAPAPTGPGQPGAWISCTINSSMGNRSGF